jgi:hypothetical protein
MEAAEVQLRGSGAQEAAQEPQAAGAVDERQRADVGVERGGGNA